MRPLTVEITYLDTKKPQIRRQGPTTKCPPRLSSTPVLAVSTLVRPVSSASLPVSVGSAPVAEWEESVKMREQQRLLEDSVPDAFLADFERDKEPSSDTSKTVKCMQKCLLPPGDHEKQLMATYWLQQPMQGRPSYE